MSTAKEMTGAWTALWWQGEALARGEYGYVLRELERFWTVVKLYPVADDANQTHQELCHLSLGGYWHVDLGDEVLLYAYREACKVAKNLGAYTLNLADYFRVETRNFPEYHRGQPRHPASKATIAALANEGWWAA